MNKLEAKLELVVVYKDKVIPRVDMIGKWPTKTWLQKRVALLKLEESKKVLPNGRE